MRCSLLVGALILNANSATVLGSIPTYAGTVNKKIQNIKIGQKLAVIKD
jgi:hypothetical protein